MNIESKRYFFSIILLTFSIVAADDDQDVTGKKMLLELHSMHFGIVKMQV